MPRFSIHTLQVAISALLVSVCSGPAAWAASSSDYYIAKAETQNIPSVLSPSERVHYRAVFDAIDAQNWTVFDTLIAEKPDGLLTQIARAEYYLHANSPKVSSDQIAQWLSLGTQLPQTAQMLALGRKRGLISDVTPPALQTFARSSYLSKRVLPPSVNDGTMPAEISAAILDKIKSDDPAGAEVLLVNTEAQLSPATLAEWRQRIAWSYYIENQDSNALRLAVTVGAGSGPWVAEGYWAAGLAAWRLGDFSSSALHFQNAALASTNDELTAAARYWASRALIRDRQPEKAIEQLRGAAFLDETLYGMLAREQMGQKLRPKGRIMRFSAADWQSLAGIKNVRIAIALHEIGREELADDVLRQQIRIGTPAQYGPIARLAQEMDIPAAQIWLAYNVPQGATPDPNLRFPVPHWVPQGGWKVDPALTYAHALQESSFRPHALSPAGARGLMQIVPSAAKDHAPKLGVKGTAEDLYTPEINMAFGQEHLNTLKLDPATQGKLPKVMAAYNAGLRPVGRWNSEIRDNGDPLLYMESIPYWETRGYVAIVMRNYWMYERGAFADSASRRALAQGQWPEFPQLPTSTPSRLTANN